MQDNISSTENGHIIELLSAYVDGRVTTVERLSVETHLASCAGCRNHLRSLQATVALLHDLPVVPAPRSFYIYPNMVPQKRKSPLAALLRPSWAFGALRLAASVASMLLVIVLAVDALGPVGSRGAAAPPPSVGYGAGAPQDLGPDSAPTQAAYASAFVTAVPAATPASAAPAVSAAVAPSPDAARAALATAVPAATVVPPAAATPAPSGAGLPPGAATQFSVGPLAPTAVPTVSAKALTAVETATLAAVATPSPKPQADTTAQPAAVATPSPSVAAAEIGKVLPPAPQPFGAPTTESAQPSPSAGTGDVTSPLRPLEVGLAVLVVALVALALVARRAS